MEESRNVQKREVSFSNDFLFVVNVALAWRGSLHKIDEDVASKYYFAIFCNIKVALNLKIRINDLKIKLA